MRFLNRLKFRTKLNLGIACIVALMALPLAILAGDMAGRALLDETKKRGLVLAENLASRSVDFILAMDLLRLKNMVDDLARVDDIAYAFVLDRQGNVLVHSFTGGFPVELLSANRVGEQAGRPEPHIRLLTTGDELIYDFATPVLIIGNPFGTVRIGLSRTKADVQVNRLVLLIFGLSGAAFLVAVGLSAIFARQVTQRIGLLRQHAEEVVKGNLDVRAGPPPAKNCWDIMNCTLTECPAHGDTRRRCWYVAGTMCPDCAPDGIEHKEDSCRECPVYIHGKGDEIQDLAETFDVMALTLRAHIDEIRAAERVLARQEQLLRTILDATPDFVCLLDDKQSFLAVNRAFATFLGHPPEEILGRRDAGFFPPEEARIITEENARVLESGIPLEREMSLYRAGRTMWLHVVRVPVLDKEGRIIGLLRTARDMTQVRLFQEQLIQSQKMESVGKLAGGVAHEINTPLGIILGYAQLLQDDVVKDSQIWNDLRIIEKQSKVCRKIVADLLGFSRQASNTKQEMCFNNSVMEAISLVRHTFSLDKVAIVTDLDERMPIIYGDPERLKQVWINLLSNAKDAMPPNGGVILVRSRLFSANQNVTAWFVDTGSGIDEETKKRIFDPFFTTKPVGLGTGLGLSVSFGIIEDHDGKISVESPVPSELFRDRLPAGLDRGPGSVFRVDLPLDHAEIPDHDRA